MHTKKAGYFPEYSFVFEIKFRNLRKLKPHFYVKRSAADFR